MDLALRQEAGLWAEGSVTRSVACLRCLHWVSPPVASRKLGRGVGRHCDCHRDSSKGREKSAGG